MEPVPYTHFAALQIVVGEITAVEIVPDADRLLALTVDVGEAEPRQIISGIREYFSDPQALCGRRCPFVINLEPRDIRGRSSHGMILAAHTDAAFSLLTFDEALPPGTPIR